MALVEMAFNMLLAVEVGNMCAMAFDRYIAIVYPLRYFWFMTNSRVIFLISLSWLVPILISSMPLAWLFSDSQETIKISSNTFGTIHVVVFHLLPCAVMLLVYTHLFIIVRKQSLRIDATRKIQERLNSSRTMTNANKRRETETSSVKVFGLVVVTFVICWSLSAYRHFCRYLQVNIKK